MKLINNVATFYYTRIVSLHPLGGLPKHRWTPISYSRTH